MPGLDSGPAALSAKPAVDRHSALAAAPGRASAISPGPLARLPQHLLRGHARAPWAAGRAHCAGGSVIYACLAFELISKKRVSAHPSPPRKLDHVVVLFSLEEETGKGASPCEQVRQREGELLLVDPRVRLTPDLWWVASSVWWLLG